MYVLDRFEGEIAVLISEEGDVKHLPCQSLSNAHEGDVFDFSDEGLPIYMEELTKSRKEQVQSRFARLVKRKKN